MTHAGAVDPRVPVSVTVAGSVATDHLMRFPGRFAEVLLADQLDRLSVSFLVEDLQVRPGGVAGNICYGLATLGSHPLLVAAVGPDFADYRARLDSLGVDTSGVRVSERHATARFVCTTDTTGCQIASFYPGAMSEAREIPLAGLADRPGGLGLVVISPDDPAAMLRHTRECRAAGWAFAADPSQQLPSLSGEQVRELVGGARYLFANAYEHELVRSKTGWSTSVVAAQAEVTLTTLGAEGVSIVTRAGEELRVPAAPTATGVDPTGVGDAFRAGFLHARGLEFPLERAAQVGCQLATLALESVGPQSYVFSPRAFLARLAESYGSAAADEVAGRLGTR